MPTDVTADRRARRTRSMLHAALVELILERGYENLTVQDILDRADVGRSTFYNHYQSKDELLLSRGQELEAAVRARISTGPQRPEGERSTSLMSPVRPLFEHVDENRALCQAMLGSGRTSDMAYRSGRTMLRDTLTTHLRAQLDVTDENRLDLAVTFVIEGMLGVLFRWLETQPQRSAVSVFADFDELATEGIRAYLR